MSSANDPWGEALDVVRDALAPLVEQRFSSEREDWLDQERTRRRAKDRERMRFFPDGRINWDPLDLINTILNGRYDLLIKIFNPRDVYASSKDTKRAYKEAEVLMAFFLTGRNAWAHKDTAGKNLQSFIEYCTQLLKLAHVDASYITKLQSLGYRPRKRFVLGLQKHVKVFIAHANEDDSEAKYYEEVLSAAGITAFRRKSLAQQFLSMGQWIEEECCFLLVLLSEFSEKSAELKKEIDLALLARKKKGGHQPVIIPLYVADVSWPEAAETANRLLRPAAASELAGNSGFMAAFDANESNERLLELMRPTLLVSRLDFFDQETFDETGVFELYEELFPNKNERDDPGDIAQWVLRDDIGTPKSFVRGGVPINYQLDSRYFILSLCGRAIGFAFLTYDYSSNLLYGNYIAVERHWRDGGVAQAFVSKIEEVLAEIFPKFRGTVFEVEKVNKQRIEQIITSLDPALDKHGGTALLSEDDELEIRKFLRVCMYEKTFGCALFFDPLIGSPLTCISPCLDPELPREDWAKGQEEYWLMWRGRGGITFDRQEAEAGSLWKEAVNTVYMEILAKSLVERFPLIAKDYWKHAQAVVSRTLSDFDAERVVLANYIGHRDGRLWERWRKLHRKVPL